jgi:hypothetical protein
VSSWTGLLDLSAALPVCAHVSLMRRYAGASLRLPHNSCEIESLANLYGTLFDRHSRIMPLNYQQPSSPSILLLFLPHTPYPYPLNLHSTSHANYLLLNRPLPPTSNWRLISPTLSNRSTSITLHLARRRTLSSPGNTPRL